MGEGIPKIKWQYQTPYMRTLNERGKLAFIYAASKQHEFEPIILEDMATWSGIHIGECADWLRLFIRQGELKPESVAEGQLDG